MNNEIYIVPQRGRWWLFKADKSIAGNKRGYLSKQSAERALWWLMQSKDVIKKKYQFEREMNQEMKHFKNI